MTNIAIQAASGDKSRGQSDMAIIIVRHMVYRYRHTAVLCTVSACVRAAGILYIDYDCEDVNRLSVDV